MAKGYRLIFWGIIFISFHITLGSFQMLPNFIGWAMITSGINKMGEICKSGSFKRASVFSGIAVIYSIINLMLELGGIYSDNKAWGIGAWIILIYLAELLTDYYLIKGSAKYLNQKGNTEMAGNLIRQFRYYLIFELILITLLCYSYTFYLKSVIMYCGVLGIILRVFFLFMISGLKKFYMEEGEAAQE